MTRVYIVTGEASGDEHGARLAKALREIQPNVDIFAAGGAALAAANVKELIPSTHFNVTGLSGLGKVLPDYIRLYFKLLRSIRTAKPDAVVFIDNPGFNLRVAKKLHSLLPGTKLVYYICPQVWAWHESRVEALKRYFTKLLVIFNFEKEYYDKKGVASAFVGHPLRDALPTPLKNGHVHSGRNIVLLPGSRTHEVRTLLPIFLEAAALIARQEPGARFTLLRASTLKPEFYDAILKSASVPVDIRTGDDKYATLSHADFAIACSGTVTLECLLCNLPAIITNRVSAFTAFVVRRLAKVKILGLPNLLAGKVITPELLQEACTPENIAQQALSWLKNPHELAAIQNQYARLEPAIGGPGASHRAAKEILALL